MAKAPTQDAVAAPQATDPFDLGAGRPALLPGSPIPDGDAAPASLHRDAVVRRLLAVADVVSAAASLSLAIALFGAGGIAAISLLALPGVLLVNKVLGLYDRDPHKLRKSTLEEAPALFHAATFYALVVFIGDRAFLTRSFEERQTFALWVLLFLLMLAARALARVTAQRLLAPERCVVIGDARSAARLTRNLASTRGANCVVVGRVPLRDDRPGGSSPPVLGSIETLGRVLAEHRLERAIVVPASSDPEELLDVVRLVRSLGVKVSVLPRLLEVVGSAVELDDVSGALLIGLRRHGLPRSSMFLKRALDLCCSAGALFVLAPPLAAIAAAIKLTDRGPILFRQTRIGRKGRPFTILKFRTMVDGADEMKAALRDRNETAGLFKLSDDPRVTSVGRLLRRASLDELPQLINVLRGEMSLVGPRPLVPDEDRQLEGWQRRRLNVMPGMTGQWQVLGAKRVPMEEMTKMDYLYGAHWSLWRDVEILLRTIPHALARRGL